MFEWMEQGWGYDVLLWFQSWRTDWVSALFAPFNYVGTDLFFIMCIAIIYWLIDKNKGRIIASFFLFTVWLNSFVKILLCRPRPYQVSVPGKEQVTHVFNEESYGIPSGHTMSTAAFFSILPYKFNKLPIIILSVFMILIVPFSRLVHGMHYPQDIILGFILTYAVFVPFVFLEKPIIHAIKKWGAKFYLPSGILLLVALYGLPFFALLKEGNSIKDIVSSFKLTTLFFGGMVGILFEAKKVHFSVKTRHPWKYFVRFLVGMVILIGIKFAFDFAFQPFQPAEGSDPSWIYFVGEFFEKFLLSFWLLGGAPAFFTVLGLADKEFFYSGDKLPQ